MIRLDSCARGWMCSVVTGYGEVLDILDPSRHLPGIEMYAGSQTTSSLMVRHFLFLSGRLLDADAYKEF